MRLFAASAFAVLLATMPVNAYAAFGLEKGAPLSSLKILEKVAKDVYQVEAPQPNTEFDKYVVYGTASQGICKVIGVGRNHGGDQNGLAIQTAFKDVGSMLSSKYGISQNTDILQRGSAWNGLSDFAMALKEHERILQSEWTKTNHSILPDDIEDITLKATADDGDTTYLILTYEFSNFYQCKAASDNADKSSL